ncbi:MULTISPECIES: hypothetical protein [unclassified Streptomyces]|uniref:hypothetical protein n=1 Tax=unclassified Streptomyces TaxID=2593676 RepID=UPI0036EE5746
MTEYIATCKTGEDDTITARADGESVELCAERNGRYMMEAYLLPANARIFARGVLALADEIDGGEQPEPAPVKVGDRVEILPSEHNPSTVGKVGIVDRIDVWDEVLPYRVCDEATRTAIAWASSVRKVDAPADTRPKVGDRLRVTKDDPWWAPVKINDVITVAETAYDRADGSQDGVRFQEHEDTYLWHVPLSSVEGPLADWEVDLLTASEPEPTPVPHVPVVPMRGHFVTHAKALLADTEHTAADIVRTAEFLAAGE